MLTGKRPYAAGRLASLCIMRVRAPMAGIYKAMEETGMWLPPLSDSYRIQTCNLLIRSQMLYSVELRDLHLNRVQRYSLII